MLLLKLAIRNIARQKRRSFLTGLSMALGFLMAALTLGMVEGSYGNIIDIFTRDRTGHVQIHFGDYLDRPSLYKQIHDADRIVAKVETVPGVIAATPRIYTPALGFANDKTSIASVVGIDPVAEPETTTIRDKQRIGPFLSGSPSPEGYDQVMIGYSLARNLGLDIGDELVLIGQGADGSIANDIYSVSAIIGTKDTAERLKVFMSLEAARRFLTMGLSAHEIALITDSPDSAIALADKVTKALDDDSLSVAPWQEVEEIFFNTMSADKKSNQVTTIIVMAMVAIGVLNAVLMSVLERTREYGLLRAVGTRPRQVFSMIVVETMMLGALACVAGLAAGLPLLNYLSKNGIPIPPTDVGGMTFDTLVTEISVFTLSAPIALVLATAFLVSLWPAARSARVTPVAALGAP